MDVKTVGVFLLCCLTFANQRVSEACSPPEGWRPLTDTEEVLMAEVVLYGRVIRTIIDHRFDPSSTAYTAEFQVYCSLKGSAPPSTIINITEAGHIPGHCISTNLEVNKEYYVLASRRDCVYRISHGELQSTREKTASVVQACGLQAKYPPGMKVADAQKCPAPKPPGECHDRKHYKLDESSMDGDRDNCGMSGARNLSITIDSVILSTIAFAIINYCTNL